MKKTYTIILACAIILLLAFFLWIGINASKERRTSFQSPTNIPTPTREMQRPVLDPDFQEYSRSELKFSLGYPKTYRVVDLTSETTGVVYKPLADLFFMPQDQTRQNTETIYVTVFAKDDATSSLSDWISANISEFPKKDSLLKGYSALYYGVEEVQSNKLNGMEVYTFVQQLEGSSEKLSGTIIGSSNYIYVLSHVQGYADDIFEKTLTSVYFQ